ncbi:MAG: hypothetical protein P1U46_02820 [Patescibacteria group bacterium]|nr:hypothetical protein [Patescibacteria group bacterium]
MSTIDENDIEKTKNIEVKVFSGEIDKNYYEKLVIENENIFSLEKNKLLINKTINDIYEKDDLIQNENIKITNGIRKNKDSFSIY